MIDIRGYNGSDYRKIIELWNKLLPHESITESMFVRKLLLDVNFDPDSFYIAEENGSILGFLNLTVRRIPYSIAAADETDMAWITAFAYSYDGIGEKLLEAAEAYAAKIGKTCISTGYYPVYFTQGVNADMSPEYVALYKNRGYTGADSICMDIDLKRYMPQADMPLRKERLESEGIFIGHLEGEYVHMLIDPKAQFGNASWSEELRYRLLQNYDLESMRIAVCGQNVIGVCVFNDPYSSVNRFGPFGVDKAYQGRGIGSVLLDDCLSEMKRRGLGSAWMQWTSGQGASGYLYERVGFKKYASYVTFTRKLKAVYG